jgi:hypothetical protein
MLKQSTIKMRTVELIFEKENGIVLFSYHKVNTNVILSLLKLKIKL